MKTVPFLPENFENIADHINSGLPIIFPTETCYGFSGDIASISAVHIVEQTKGRENKPFLVLVSNIDMMHKFGHIPPSKKEVYEKMIEEKPTTFLVPKTKNVPHTYFSSFTEIGIRVPLYKPVLGFLQYYKKPIFSTSANISGNPPLYTSHEITKAFGDIPSLLFVDAGDLPKNPPSRIVRVGEEGVEILRE